MMRRLFALLRDRRAAGAVEFALVAPPFVFLLNGIAQLGIIFFASAGLHNALAEAARHTTVFRGDTNAEIEIAATAKIEAERWGMDSDELTLEPFVYANNNGAPYVEITLNYDVKPNMIFFDMGTITLKQTRRAYLFT